MRRLLSSLAPVALAALTLLTPALPAALAGPLSPPSGPVAPTFKPLGDVEPRTPIRQPDAPASSTALVVIDQPGSYYLASDLDAGDRSAIVISASNVTIDLAGFTIRGNFASTTRSGITTSGQRHSITIRNGQITGFSGAAVQLNSPYADNALVENLQIRACRQGILNSNSFAGIYRGNIILFDGYPSTVQAGAAIEAGSASLVQDNQVLYTAAGDESAILAGATSRIVGNTIRSAPTVAITAPPTGEVSGNIISGAGGDAIVAAGQTRVTGNTIYAAGFRSDTGAGVRATGAAVIDDNFIASCDIAIVTTGGSSITRNRLRGNSANFSTTSSDVLGPVITPATAATATNPLANILQ